MPALEFVPKAAESERSIEGAIGDVRAVLLYTGTISAALLAGTRRMGMFGVVVFGVNVANGGGTTRDVLLGDLPVFWIDDPSTLIVAALAAAATIPLFRIGAIKAMQRLDLVRLFDTVGLALFTIIGTNAALDARAALEVALLETSMSPAIASSIAGVAIITLRLVSIHLDWRVSRFTIDDGENRADSR
jgi:uncharacterized membrane protein YeiH